jgi:hypothetical protein
MDAMLSTERPTLPLDEIAACEHCSQVPTPSRWSGDWWVTCSDCYDGAPDSSTRGDCGFGHTKSEAINDWNETVESNQ